MLKLHMHEHPSIDSEAKISTQFNISQRNKTIYLYSNVNKITNIAIPYYQALIFKYVIYST